MASQCLFNEKECAYVNNKVIDPSSDSFHDDECNKTDVSYNVELDVKEYVPTEKQVYEKLAAIVNVLNSLKRTNMYNSKGTKIGISTLSDMEGNERVKIQVVETIKNKIFQCCREYEMMKMDIKNRVEVHTQLNVTTYWNTQHSVDEESILNLNAFIAFSNIIYEEYLAVLALFNIDPFINYNV